MSVCVLVFNTPALIHQLTSAQRDPKSNCRIIPGTLRAQLIQTRNGDSKLLTEMEQKDPYFEQQGFKAPFTLSVLPLPENKGRLFDIIKAQGVHWKGIWKTDKENKKRNASGPFVPLLTT